MEVLEIIMYYKGSTYKLEKDKEEEFGNLKFKVERLTERIEKLERLYAESKNGTSNVY